MGANKSIEVKRFPQEIPQTPLDIICDLHPDKKITHLKFGLTKDRKIFCSNCLAYLGSNTSGILTIEEFLEKSAQKAEENKGQSHFKKRKSQVSKLDSQGFLAESEAEIHYQNQKKNASNHSDNLLTHAEEKYNSHDKEVFARFDQQAEIEKNNFQAVIDALIMLYPTEADAGKIFLTQEKILELLKAESDSSKVEEKILELNKTFYYSDSSLHEIISSEKRKEKVENLKKVLKRFQEESKMVREEEKWRFIKENYEGLVDFRIRSDFAIRTKVYDFTYKYKSKILRPGDFDTVSRQIRLYSTPFYTLIFSATPESKLSDLLSLKPHDIGYMIVMETEAGLVLGFRFMNSELAKPDEELNERVCIFSLTNDISFFIQRVESPKFKSLEQAEKYRQAKREDPDYIVKYFANENELNIGDGQFVLKKNLLSDAHQLRENGNLRIDAVRLAGGRQFKIKKLEVFSINYQ